MLKNRCERFNPLVYFPRALSRLVYSLSKAVLSLVFFRLTRLFLLAALFCPHGFPFTSPLLFQSFSLGTSLFSCLDGPMICHAEYPLLWRILPEERSAGYR